VTPLDRPALAGRRRKTLIDDIAPAHDAIAAQQPLL